MKQLKHIGIFFILLICIGLLGACGIQEVDYDAEGYTAQVEFRFNGGILTTPTSSVSDYITYRYKPGALIVNPLTSNGYSISRYDSETDLYYECTGWYKDEDCTIPWDFTVNRAAEGKVTLYAGWKRIIKYTYTLYYTDDDGEIVSIGEPYSVNVGDTFSDPYDRADNREGYTPWILAERFYSDSECTVLWQDDFVHPGGEDDTDIPVYVKYVKGEWALVTDYQTLSNALTANSNIWLINDIDCGGAEWRVSDYSGVFDGKEHKVYNFRKTFDYSFGEAYIFRNLTGTAKIADVSFEDFVYVVKAQKYLDFDAAGLALSVSSECKIENVSVKGTVELASGAEIHTGENSNGEFVFEPLTAAHIQDAFAKAVRDDVADGVVTGFEAKVTIIDKAE